MKRLDELADQYGLSSDVVASLSALLRLLETDPGAPTTVRDPARGVDVHVADALTALALPEIERAATAADVGAGAGIPGLVLAAARPDVLVTEVESASRKCAFIERAVAAMGLGNVRTACVRAEEWEAGRGSCDLITARAVAPLSVLVEYAAPLLRVGGALVAWKAAPDPPEEADGDAAARLLGLDPGQRVPVMAYPGCGPRRLYVYLKVRSLPNDYPRRPGMARKRPIKASGGG